MAFSDLFFLNRITLFSTHNPVRSSGNINCWSQWTCALTDHLPLDDNHGSATILSSNFLSFLIQHFDFDIVLYPTRNDYMSMQ